MVFVILLAPFILSLRAKEKGRVQPQHRGGSSQGTVRSTREHSCAERGQGESRELGLH